MGYIAAVTARIQIDPLPVQGYAFGAGADYFFAKAWGTRALAQMLADVMSR
jgi:hypothetical protein